MTAAPPGLTLQPAEASTAILERLLALHPKRIDLSLGRIERLLVRLGNPERRLPPVVHVAGTNGKGSVIAFLRAILSAHGLTSHVYTSPHLMRFHERIVVTGHEIDDTILAALLSECEAANGGAPITFFEITTAAAFLAFARSPADVTLLETGLGGRLDATNMVERPSLTAITPVDLDHQDFLGDTVAAIAAEKAGILKAGVPCVLARQAPAALTVIRARAAAVDAPVIADGVHWHAAALDDGLHFRGLGADLGLPPPALAGPFQTGNAAQALALAIQFLGDRFDPAAAARGIAGAVWPARLQRLTTGPLVQVLPAGWELWLDGGHNPSAGRALAAALPHLKPAMETVLICGIMANKDVAAFLAALTPVTGRLIAVPVPDQDGGTPPEIVAATAAGLGLVATTAYDVVAAVTTAVADTTRPTRLLIAGSLYLAGDVLRRL